MQLWEKCGKIAGNCGKFAGKLREIAGKLRENCRKLRENCGKIAGNCENLRTSPPTPLAQVPPWIQLLHQRANKSALHSPTKRQ